MENEKATVLEFREERNLDRLMAWRSEVIEHVFGEEPTRELLAANREYYRSHIADGSHCALIASAGGVEIGCGGVCFGDELPSPDNPTGRCAYLMNIYVRENYRSHGTGHEIVRRLIEKAGERDCGKIYLETTDDGRPVYASLGFKDMEGMMKL